MHSAPQPFGLLQLVFVNSPRFVIEPYLEPNIVLLAVCKYELQPLCSELQVAWVTLWLGSLDLPKLVIGQGVGMEHAASTHMPSPGKAHSGATI